MHEPSKTPLLDRVHVPADLKNLSDGANLLNLILGIFALLFGTLNVVGGFVVTDRMLEMFKKKKK